MLLRKALKLRARQLSETFHGQSCIPHWVRPALHPAVIHFQVNERMCGRHRKTSRIKKST